MPCFFKKFCLVSVLLASALLTCSPIHAQTTPQDTSVHPITSLPKAPDDPTNTAMHPQAPQPAAPPAAAPAAPPPTTDTTAAPATEPPPSAPVPVYAPEPALQGSTAAVTPPPPRLQRKQVHFFSTVAIGVDVGIGGVGGQIAAPLTQTTNIRVGADFFSYSKNFVENGLHFAGDIKFRSGNINLDWFPFHGAFRISPGITVYNGNTVDATVTTAPGQVFELADTTYTSSTVDPVRGSASVAFGNRVAPQLTMGFGNMIPRSGRHFSVPFEIGVEYIGAPLVTYNLQGTACSGSGLLMACANVATDPTIQANVQQEQNELNADIYGLRFYPVLRLGFAYKF